MTRSKIIAAAIVAAMPITSIAGPLSPPAGPIASTGKTLDQIQPRRAINDLPGAADAVHVITESGNYYLDSQLTGANGKHCIDIRLTPADTGVINIDLGGFAIVGGPGSLDGIRCVAPPSLPVGGINIALEQRDLGHITNCGADAIHCENVRRVSIAGLTMTDCGDDAIEINNAAAAANDPSNWSACYRFDNIDVRGSAGSAITANFADSCIISNAVITDTGADSVVVEDSDFLVAQDTRVQRSGGSACRFDRAVQAVVDGVSIIDPMADGLVIGDGEAATVSNCIVVNAGTTAYRFYNKRKFASESCAAISPGAIGFDIDDIDAVRLNSLVVTDAGSDACHINDVSSLVVTGEGISMTTPAGDGLVIENCDDVTVANCSVTNAGGTAYRWWVNNKMKEAECESVSAGNVGLDVRDGGTLTLNGFTATDSGADAIRCLDTNNVTIAHVRCVNNNTSGAGLGGAIFMTGGSTVGIANTACENNQGDAIHIATNTSGISPTVVCKNVSLKMNTARGIFVEAGSGTITNCDLVANADFAIETGPGFSGSITNNRCHGNAGAISVNGFGCCVAANMATAGGLGFISVPVPGNVVGPLVEELSIGTSCSPFANILY